MLGFPSKVMKGSTDSYYYIALAALTLVNIGLGLFNVHLSRSGFNLDFATGLAVNIAILSLVIVVSGVLVTVFGLARLKSIEDKAIESATNEARIVARSAVSEELKGVIKNMEVLYERGMETISFLDIFEEEEQGGTDNDTSGNR